MANDRVDGDFQQGIAVEPPWGGTPINLDERRTAVPKIILLGDPNDHGGQVMGSGAPRFTVGGRPVALAGDPCSCPKRGHHNCTIAEGDPSHTFHGVPVAYENHRTTCGARLIATVPNYTKT